MEKIDLERVYPFLKGGSLKPLVIEEISDQPNHKWLRPAVIVVPGGAYAMVSEREGAVVASRFLSEGFQTFVLTYSVARDGASYPDQLEELSAAIDYVKKNAEQYHVNPKEIFAMGFSAGGHLVANLAMEAPRLKKEKGLDCTLCAIGLGYPVISNHSGMGKRKSGIKRTPFFGRQGQKRQSSRLYFRDRNRSSRSSGE